MKSSDILSLTEVGQNNYVSGVSKMAAKFKVTPQAWGDAGVI